ncbi:DMT family transporter [candidate division KSB1 bacterium]|nr:DMT family transporter [candidate division KSB1 bacterium]
MPTRVLKSDSLLLLTAAIWGFAFVAQRLGMEHLGPFIFNAVRFALGAVAMAPFALNRGTTPPENGSRMVFAGSITAGLFLFLGASLQQIGIVFTTAGKAGFITGLYVVLVPFIGVILKQTISLAHWIGALLAAIGLYFLTVTGSLTVVKGDLFVLFSAFFFAGHLHIIGWLSPKMASSRIALVQFTIVSLLSFIAALAIETFTVADILDAAIPILYGGLMSVGVAYTLQVVAQKEAPPTHAAIILSLEAVFAVLGGWLILSEVLALRSLFGCALMLAGMLVSQTAVRLRKKLQ